MIKQLLLISSAILICVLIYTASRTKQETFDNQSTKTNGLQGLDVSVEDAVAQLAPSDKKRFESLNLQLETKTDIEKLAIFDSLKVFWDEKRVDIAAYYASLIADKNPTEQNHIEAAIRFFDAFRFTDDSLKKKEFVSRAIVKYESALELNPENLNVKTDLGVCYTEGTGEPMKGIGLLLEVIKEDPKHENAQMNLGFLSVKSGQYEKAIERFDKVLEINPLKSEVYLFKAQTQMRMGNNEGALESFQSFTEISTDQEMISEVKKYIKQIKNI